MWIPLIFIAVPYCYADEAVYNIIRSKLNNKIKPCENFHGHVCSNIKRARDLIPSQDTRTIEDVIEQYLPREYMMFERRLQIDTELSNRNDISHDEYTDYLLDRCYTKGSIEGLVDLFYVNETRPNGSCAEIVMQLSKQIAEKSKDADPALQRATRKHKHIANAIAYYSYIEQLGDKFRDSEAVVYDLFKDLRANLLEMIQNSKWVHKRGISRLLKENVKFLELYRWNHIASMFTTALKAIHASYKYCAENVITGLRPIEIAKCANKAVNEGIYLIDETAYRVVKMGVDKRNGQYHIESRSILILPSFYINNDNDTITQLGKIGTVMGHELGHSIFKAHETINPCLLKMSQKSCEIFSQKECHSGEITQIEDAADWSGVRTSLNLIKILEHGGNTSLAETASKVIGRKLTAIQLYFYSYAAANCNHRSVHKRIKNKWEVHSPTVVRINTVRMFPEFHQAFGCKAGDPMFTGEDEKCILAGPDATHWDP